MGAGCLCCQGTELPVGGTTIAWAERSTYMLVGSKLTSLTIAVLVVLGARRGSGCRSVRQRVPRLHWSRRNHRPSRGRRFTGRLAEHTARAGDVLDASAIGRKNLGGYP